MTLMYEENLVGMREIVLCVQKVIRWRLVTANSDRYFVSITCLQKRKTRLVGLDGISFA